MTLLYCIVLYCIVLYCIVLYCIVLYCIVLYCIVLYCIVLYGMVWYGIVSYYIILYHIISYHLISYQLYDIILHYIILYYIILYYIIYIILYYIILYHIISYHLISSHIISYHIISYYIILYYITVHYITLYYLIFLSYLILSYLIILYYIILYYIILYYIILYYIILYYIKLNYIILYYIICYVMLCYVMLCYVLKIRAPCKVITQSDARSISRPTAQATHDDLLWRIGGYDPERGAKVAGEGQVAHILSGCRKQRLFSGRCRPVGSLQLLPLRLVKAQRVLALHGSSGLRAVGCLCSVPFNIFQRFLSRGSMKAWGSKGSGCELLEQPQPQVKPGSCIIRVSAVGLNPTDWKHVGNNLHHGPQKARSFGLPSVYIRQALYTYDVQYIYIYC